MTFRELGHFYGEDLKEYDKQSGYVSYQTLGRAVGAMDCDLSDNADLWDVLGITEEQAPEPNEEMYGDELYPEICYYMIITKEGKDILENNMPNEFIYYSKELDIYFWGITFYGASWSNVPTEISIDEEF
jgi:hypothetical protein